MTHAKLCLQSAIYRSFLIACFAILISVLLPSAAQAQQSSVPQTCEVQTKSCCNTCGSCDSGPSCPAGYTIYDDYCLPECPTGYLRYPGYPGLCLPPCDHGCPEGYDQVPLPSCPQGYHRNLRNPDECLPDQQHVLSRQLPGRPELFRRKPDGVRRIVRREPIWPKTACAAAIMTGPARTVTSATSGPAPACPAAIGRMTTSGFACHRARRASRVTSITPRAACRRRKPAPSGLRISASNACRFASRARPRNSYGYCLPPRLRGWQLSEPARGLQPAVMPGRL